MDENPNIVGTVKKERPFRVKFNIDEEKLKIEVNKNLYIYVEMANSCSRGKQ